MAHLLLALDHELTSLDHEVLDAAVEGGALETKPLRVVKQT